MSKIKTLNIGFLSFLALTAVLLFWPKPTHAGQADFFKEQCKEDQCCLQYTQAIGAAEADWNTYVNDLMAQPKATSKKMDQAFEGLRTYNCWVRYVCEAVRVSAVVEPRKLEDGIRAENLDGALPGCQAPENVQFGDKWAEFVTALDEQDDLIASINQPNRVAYMPACITNPPYNEKIDSSDFTKAEAYYQNCLKTAELILGCSQEDCSGTPSALAGLEITAKKDHANQRASALGLKLYDINRKVSIMQQVVDQVKNFLQSINLRYECAPFTQCT